MSLSCPKHPTRQVATSRGTTQTTWTPWSVPVRTPNSCVPRRPPLCCPVRMAWHMTALHLLRPHHSRPKPVAPDPLGCAFLALAGGIHIWCVQRLWLVGLGKDVYFFRKRIQKHLAAQRQCQAVGCYPPETLVAEGTKLWLWCVGAVPTLWQKQRDGL